MTGSGDRVDHSAFLGYRFAIRRVPLTPWIRLELIVSRQSARLWRRACAEDEQQNDQDSSHTQSDSQWLRNCSLFGPAEALDS